MKRIHWLSLAADGAEKNVEKKTKNNGHLVFLLLFPI